MNLLPKFMTNLLPQDRGCINLVKCCITDNDEHLVNRPIILDCKNMACRECIIKFKDKMNKFDVSKCQCGTKHSFNKEYLDKNESKVKLNKEEIKKSFEYLNQQTQSKIGKLIYAPFI
jgi:hypothetical protein